MTQKLWTTQEVAEELCKRRNINSDYGLAKFLGVDAGTVGGWRKGFRVMSDEHAATLAPLIGEDPGWLALCLAVERVKLDNLAEKMRDVLLAAPNRVALVALGFSLGFAPYLSRFGIA